MSGQILLRRMAATDLDRILQIEKQIFTDPWTKKSYQYELYGNRFSMPLVLEVNGLIAGYTVVWKIYEDFHIATFGITPEFQGKGWGKFLLKSILEFVDDATRAVLEVRQNNKRAIALYQTMGFNTVAIRKRYYRDGENALVMEMPLQPPERSDVQADNKND